MNKRRERLREDPRKSGGQAQPGQDNSRSRQGEGRQNAQLGDRGASAAAAGEGRETGLGKHGGNRKPAAQR